jgi:hypothetical protein
MKRSASSPRFRETPSLMNGRATALATLLHRELHCTAIRGAHPLARTCSLARQRRRNNQTGLTSRKPDGVGRSERQEVFRPDFHAPGCGVAK